MTSQLVDTWNTHNRISLYLLDAIEKSSLASHSASKGRSVGEQFAHIHNVRLMWLKSAAPELLKGQQKIEGEAAHDKTVLKSSLVNSGKAIATLLESSLESAR